MPVLPKYQPQVKAQLSKTPAFTMRSANVDINTSKLEQGLNNVVKAAETIQMDIDNAKFNEMHTDYIQKQERKFRSVETVDGKPDSEPVGIFNKPQFKGINAIDLPKTVQQGFDELVDETTQKAGVSPSMAAYFKRKMTEQYGGRLMAEANDVAVKEIERGKISAAGGLVDAKRAQWMKNGVDHPEYFSGLNELKAMTRELNILNHQDPHTASVNADKTIRTAVYDSLVNKINADPDAGKAMVEDKRYSQYLNDTDRAKLDDHVLRVEDKFVKKSSETIYNSVILPRFEKKGIIPSTDVTNTKEFEYIKAKNPTMAMQMINTVERHNENTVVDNVMSYIAKKRDAGLKIFDYRQLPADLWDNLVTYAPSKADQLMNRFDTEKEMRAARAAANKETQVSEANILAAVIRDPARMDRTAIIEARDSGRITPAFAKSLIDVYDKGTDYLGKVRTHMDEIDRVIDARLPRAKESERKAVKEQMLATIVAAAPSIYKNASDIGPKDIEQAARVLDNMILKEKGFFSGPKTFTSMSPHDDVKVPGNRSNMVEIVKNKFPGMTTKQALGYLEIVKQQGRTNPLVHTGRRR